jgi:hypothetical protein
MRSAFDHAGIHLTVASGDMIDGAVIVDHLRRTGMPAVHGFATAIVNAATTAASSSIVYVGGSDYLMTA